MIPTASPDTTPALEVSSLGKYYALTDRPMLRLLSQFLPSLSQKIPGFWALREVSFRLRRGETLGVIGRNGSGKSTLLQIICGTLTPSSGQVRTEGRVAALLELGSGFNPRFTGRENILLNAAIYGLTQEQVRARMDAIIAFAGIGDFIDQPVKRYSSGMFVRLAFAVVAHVDADILVIDEALAVGDALFAQKCMRFLDEFKKRGTILFVSHSAGMITRLCDRAIWLDGGRVRQMGEASAVSEAYLESIYEQQQDVVTAKKGGQVSVLSAARDEEWHDARAGLLAASTLRNDLELFRFDPQGREFGTGKVQFLDVCLRDPDGRRLSWVVGGSRVVLEIGFQAQEDLKRVIIGFVVKDRTGQVLFGENNALFHQDTPVDVEAHQAYVARFGLILPYLPEGEYVISVAVATGTQLEHVQHCWRHDALVFTAHASHVVHGLMGVPVSFCDIGRRED
jgi:lipopolysaccharide transport system ATP-binding protein